MSNTTEALKLARETLEENRHLIEEYEQPEYLALYDRVISVVTKALAEQQEPYGWKVYGVNTLFTGKFAEDDAKAEAKRIGGTCIAFPLYTSTPARKPWVSLTGEEVKHQWEIWRANVPRYVGFAIGIDAALKEKNCG